MQYKAEGGAKVALLAVDCSCGSARGSSCGCGAWCVVVRGTWRVCNCLRGRHGKYLAQTTRLNQKRAMSAA